MRKNQRPLLIFLLAAFYLILTASGFAQDELIPVIKFKDADIKIVLQSIAEKAVKDGKKVNIVPSPTVEGLVSVSLESVDWQTALKSILDAYNYGYRWIGDNIILVATVEEIKEKELQERERQEIEAPRVKVFKLKYLDANDAKKAIEPVLSPSGRASVLEVTGQAGWEFGTDVTKRSRAAEGKISRSKILIVSDVSKKIDEIEDFLREIDVMPQQILIKARIMEVNRDLLRDIGFDWGTGTVGAESATGFTQLDLNSENEYTAGGHALTGLNEPSAFGPKTTGIDMADTALKVVFRKLTGAQFEVIMHALEEDTRANILSAPVILTLNNQEASILIGTKYPIISTQISEDATQVIGGSLDKYEEVGIQLNVVPQICGENDEFINVIVHPAVTSRSDWESVTSTQGDTTTTLVRYPVITSREAETQIIVRDGETIVMGGLLRDIRAEQEIGIPILKSLPLIGGLFRRTTYDTEKIDLLVFITAQIVKPGEHALQTSIEASQIISEFER